jgi:hypothetical protein
MREIQNAPSEIESGVAQSLPAALQDASAAG